MNKLPIFLLWVLPLAAQQPLSFADALKTALARHPSLEAATAQTKASAARVEQARSGYLPRVNYQESWMRSDNPVFVFSSLLTQHQFTERNFAIGPLNRPDFLNNFQSQVTVDQMVYDFGQTKSQVRAAELGRGVREEDERRARMQIIANVVRTYYGAVLAAESLHTAQEAVKSAEADLSRAESIRGAGMSTDADVLSVRVHLSAMREAEIRRSQDVEVARAALNEALGLPLETAHDLTTPLASAAKTATGAISAVERPEARQARLMREMAEVQSAAARSAYWPQIGLRGAFEADRQRFVNRGGANWTVGASVRWNLFNGFETRARIGESLENLRAAQARERQTASGVALELRQAQAAVTSSAERLTVSQAAVDMASESVRIIRNRYEAGLTTVTELLRAEAALYDARTRRLAAIYDQRVSAAALEYAAGTLSPDSPALQ